MQIIYIKHVYDVSMNDVPGHFSFTYWETSNSGFSPPVSVFACIDSRPEHYADKGTFLLPWPD